MAYSKIGINMLEIGEKTGKHYSVQRPPDLTNRLGQDNYSLNPEIRYYRIFYEVKIFFHLKNHSLNPAIC